MLFGDIKAQLRQRFDAYNKYVESVYKLTWDSAMYVFRRHINIFTNIYSKIHYTQIFGMFMMHID